MGTTRIRSRILQYFSKDLLRDLYKICRSSVISDNNLKVEAMIETMRNHGLEFDELGPGTNRLAILIENYVFKIALDKWGIRDNLNEFTMSQELQPYVVKTYETNELISVCEYVTVISREEFEERKEEIRRILAVLAESYLLGDVGTVGKNFCNWGYRDNGELVILDFAYIFRVKNDQLLCSKDQAILEYDENFHSLRCPVCSRKYTFMDIRRRISMEEEEHENMIAKELAYKLTKPVQEFSDGYKDDEPTSSLYKKNSTSKSSEEVIDMKYHSDEEYISKEEQEKSYLEALALVTGQASPTETEEQTMIDEVPVDKNVNTNVLEIHKETPTDRTTIRVFRQGNNPSNTEEAMADVVETVQEAVEEVSAVESMVADEEDIIDEMIAEIRQNNPDAAIEMETEETTMVASDGTVTEETTIGITAYDDVEEIDEDQIIEVELEEPHGEIYRESNTVIEQGEDNSVVIENTVHLTDNITIENKVKIQGDDEFAESLRRELLQQQEEEEANRIEELAAPYEHLEEEIETRKGKGGRKGWE